MKRNAISLGTHGIIGASVLLACSAASAQVTINEVRIEQAGSDIDEFVELKGQPGASLDGYTYIVIGDCDSFPPTQNGCIEAVVDLTGSAIMPSGYFVLAEATFTLGNVDLFTDLNFEGNDNVTHLLVQGFTGNLGDDLDTNDDGVLDVTPWTSVSDCFAFLRNDMPDGASDEYFYCEETVGPDGSFVPGYAYRCEDTGALRIGDFNVGVDETPGAPNPDCDNGGGGGGGTALISEFRIDQPSSDTDEYFEIAGEPGTSLDGIWFVSLGDGTGGSGVVETAIDLTGGVIGSSGYFVVAEETFTLGTPDLLGNVNFENSDNLTFFLVRDFTGAAGDDLDATDDGILDEPLAWTEVLDDVAAVESFTSGELIYSSNTVGPDGSFVPGHAYRCSPEGDWTIGNYGNFDADTPGAENLPCPVILCGGDEPKNCFEVRPDVPGCSDTTCCDLVSAVDSSCGDTSWDQDCVDIANQVCLSQNPAPAVALNEFRMKQAGPDNDEFVEIVGAPGTSLDGTSLVVVGGTGVDINGFVETAVNLSGYSINANGYFVIAEATFTLGAADAIADLNFTDSGNKTLLLVHNFTGTVNGDLDANDDCTLDTTPWDAQVDGVNVIGGSYVNCTYASATCGPDGDFTPGHGYICDGSGTWGIGTFAADDAAAADSPGTANPSDCDVTDCEEAIARGLDVVATDLLETYVPGCCSVWDQACDDFLARNLTFESAAPVQVDVVEIRIDQISNDNDEFIELLTVANQSLDGYSVCIIGDGATGSGEVETRIPLIDVTSDENGLVVIADAATFTLGTPTYDYAFDIENSDNLTCIVVYGFSGDDLSPDLDAEDDGVLDFTPWVESTSCVALIETDPATAGDQVYCDVRVGPADTFVPGHAFYDCALEEWQIGLFDPVGETDTPGVLNNGCEPLDGGGNDCPGDLNGDGIVDGADLSGLLGGWGQPGDSDLNGDGNTDGADLSTLLGNWGPC